MARIRAVCAIGNLFAAPFAEVVFVLVAAEYPLTVVAKTVVILVGAHVSFAFVTVVTLVNSVVAKAVSAPIAVVILVGGVGAAGNHSFTAVAQVVFVNVGALAEYGETYVASVVGISVDSALTDGR